jgi:hypothetical protein
MKSSFVGRIRAYPGKPFRPFSVVFDRRKF